MRLIHQASCFKLHFCLLQTKHNTPTQILPHIIVDGRVVDVLHHPPSTLVIPQGTTFVIYIDKIMFNISSLKIFGIQGWLFHNITSHRLDLHLSIITIVPLSYQRFHGVNAGDLHFLEACNIPTSRCYNIL